MEFNWKLKIKINKGKVVFQHQLTHLKKYIK